MAVIDYIDPVTRRIYLSASTVGVDLVPMDIYTEMRAIRAAGNDVMRGQDVFLVATGNEDIGGGSFTPRFVRCEKGTRIVPFDTDHELTVTGNLITDDGQKGVSCFDRSSLSISTVVDINYTPPQVEVITVQGGSGLSTEQDGILRDIWAGSVLMAHVDANYLGTSDGSPSKPFKSISTAVAYANIKGWQQLHLHSDVTLDSDLQDFDVIAVGTPVVNLNGYDVTGSTFYECRLSGTSTGEYNAQKCFLMHGLSGMNGIFWQCALGGDLVAEVGGYILIAGSTFSGIPGSNRPSMSLANDASAQFALRGFEGGFELRDTVTGAAVTLGLNHGEVRLAASVTGGDIHVRGIGYFENLGTATPVTRSLLNPSNISASGGVTAQNITDIVDAVWDEPLIGHSAVGSTGEQLSNTSVNVDTNAIATAVWAHVSRTLTDTGNIATADVNAIRDAVWLAASRTLTDPSGVTAQDIIDIANAVWDKVI